MIDPLDTKLGAAGRVPTDDAHVREALHALVADRAAPARSRRRLLPAVSIGVTIVILGGTAAAASQWGPWTWVTDPDLVYSREWFDVDGNSLGSCETRTSLDSLTDDQKTAVRDYVDALDVDALQPSPEAVAGRLLAAGRPEDFNRLLSGVDTTDFELYHEGELWTGQVSDDARIMQDGLSQVVWNSLAGELTAQWPDLVNTLQGKQETQCITDSLYPSAP
ncbi:hypothetical protein [Rathayibacter sp. SD072]|uniref:hypothetical protein n=1 Tax=Rathayibacter sp. SD072 TaxID=2781731 RepID=UPI001A96AA19|nr:hypothetical protein [Rathayibacter sp. SD072]MBO0985000.1 hypothetical protein [Rathayibacter sp. SD072]